jgi:hypothetical protein
MGVGYSVLVEWPNGVLKITCERVCFEDGRASRQLFLIVPTAASASAGKYCR